MSVSQMNIRIDSATKTAGDRVFSAIGYTPTEVARTVWGFAAAHADDTRAVQRQLEEMRAIDLEAQARRERRRLAVEGLEALDRRLSSLAGDGAPASASADDGELLEEALVARLEERGLW